MIPIYETKKQTLERIMTKQERFEKVAENALVIAHKRGLSCVTFSSVSRGAKVSRSWIYKYIGRNPEDLLKTAVNHYGVVFSEMNTHVECHTRSSLIKDLKLGNLNLLRDCEQRTWLLPLYFRFRNERHVLAECIREIENQYLLMLAHKISTALNIHKNDATPKAEILTATRLGLVHWLQTHPVKSEDLRDRILMRLDEVVEGL